MSEAPEPLLARLRRDPEDANLRRQLGIAWDRAGDPRGAWLGAALDLAATPRWAPERPAREERAKNLRAPAEAAWRDALGPAAACLRLRGGLPTHVAGEATQILETLDRAHGPLPALSLELDLDVPGPDEALRRLATHPGTAHVCELHLVESEPGPDRLAAAFPAGGWPALRALRLAEVVTEADQAAALAAAPMPDGLRILEFEGVTDGLGPAGVRALAAAAWLPRLSELVLRGQHLDDRAIEAIAAAPLALDRLDLASVGYADHTFGPDATRALAGRPWFAGLRTLNLVGCPTGTATVDAVRAAPGLEHAYLSRTGLTAADLDALVAAPCWPRLRELTLAGNPLGTAGARRLAAAGRLPDVTNLRDTGLDEHTLDALAAAPAVAALDLRVNPIPATAWERAIRTERLPRATALAIDGRHLSADLCAALTTRYPRLDLH